MKIFRQKAFLRIAALSAIGLGTSGCVYDMGLGYASDGYYGDGYYDDAYGCDPYGGYDTYYQCDYGSGFNNIGYGGGWYDNYWYPGYGFFLFDNGGRRYPMRDHHRRYWGEKRHNWYREHRGRDHDGGQHHGRSRDGSHNATPGVPRRPDGAYGSGHNGADRDDRRDGRPRRGDQWHRDDNVGAQGRPVRDGDAVSGQRPGRRGGEGYGRPDRGNDNNAVRPVTPRAPRAGTPVPTRSGESRGRGYSPPPAQPAATGEAQPAPRPTRVAPAVRPQRPERPARQSLPDNKRLSDR